MQDDDGLVFFIDEIEELFLLLSPLKQVIGLRVGEVFEPGLLLVWIRQVVLLVPRSIGVIKKGRVEKFLIVIVKFKICYRVILYIVGWVECNKCVIFWVRGNKFYSFNKFLPNNLSKSHWSFSMPQHLKFLWLRLALFLDWSCMMIWFKEHNANLLSSTDRKTNKTLYL